MKIAVIGAGAMGSIFGARLKDGGHDVILVDVVEPLVAKINEEGVTLVRGEEERSTRVPATTDPTSVGIADLVIFFTKCYHTASAAESARPLVGDETIVASLQNGWGNGDVLARVFPPEKLALGVTYNSGLLLGPGRVVHPAEQPTVVGSWRGEDSAIAERFASALEEGGFETTVAAPVQPEIWKKLVLNAATLPTSALVGATAGQLASTPELRELVTETAHEAVAVARALGYDIDPEERVGTIHALLEKAGPSKGSMLQDFEGGRRTEIDVINGAVVAGADQTGVPVPLNHTFLRLVKGWEAVRGLH
jgi:2-dehydropantoate 2-reductase